MDVIVSAIGAAIALVALVVSIAVARRQTAIQERLTAIEEARRAEEVEARARARVTASFESEDRQVVQVEPRNLVLGNRLVLHNEGPALARDVKAEVASEGGGEGPEVFGLEEALPCDLQPGQRMPFRVTTTLGDSPTIRVTVRWTDDAGDHEELFKLLTL